MKPLTKKTPEKIIKLSKIVFSTKKIALFIVAYNAEKHIAETLARIPEWCRNLFSEIYIIDDSSDDKTFSESIAAGKSLGLKNLSVMKTPGNQGYGGNQKIGYTYAIERNHDIVILLHADGQYPPEYIPEIVAGYADSNIDAVFGSRMKNRLGALRGGMPIYKWAGNQILTSIENTILGTHLSEFHSGYRSYKTALLKKIPFHLNNNGFHFDTDIIIQLNLIGGNILEIPMPTHYGNEKCYVNGTKYAWNCIKSAVKSRLHQAGIFFQPSFEIIGNEIRNYHLKSAETSLHSFILRLRWKQSDNVVDFGANDGILSKKIAGYGSNVTAIDINIPDTVSGIKAIKFDLNEDLGTILEKNIFDKALALDIIEHVYSPEQFTEQIHQALKPNGFLLASTANIGYIVMRLTHLIGWFNYGKKGILDRTHHRLFTIKSFRRLLENAGFSVLRIKGFGPPLVDAFGDTAFWRIIDKICSFLADLYPSLFAFNFLVIAKKRFSIEEKTNFCIQTKAKSYRRHS